MNCTSHPISPSLIPLPDPVQEPSTLEYLLKFRIHHPSDSSTPFSNAPGIPTTKASTPSSQKSKPVSYNSTSHSIQQFWTINVNSTSSVIDYRDMAGEDVDVVDESVHEYSPGEGGRVSWFVE
jgi:hypothetical protein